MSGICRYIVDMQSLSIQLEDKSIGLCRKRVRLSGMESNMLDGSQRIRSFIQATSVASLRVIFNSLSVHQIREAGS
jgi:hypothetical protein